jgi:putative peptide zinc metalloprotease protein
VRLGADASQLLAAWRRDPSADPDQLARHLGAPWTAPLVRRTLERLAGAGLLDQGPAAAPRRVRRAGPVRVELNLLSADRSRPRARPWSRSILHPAVPLAALLLALAGAVALAAATPPAGGPSWGVVMAVSLIVFGPVHEAAHAVVLRAHGGRVDRVGVMLLYGIPSLFCDVSDAWSLSTRRHRTGVVLAGPTASFALAGVTALAAPWAGPASATLHALALVTYGNALINLIPFLELDGYLALVTALDRSHLRAHALHDWRDLVVATVTRRPRRPELPGVTWAPAFGAGCAAAPVVLVVAITWALTPLGLVAAVVPALFVAHRTRAWWRLLHPNPIDPSRR